MFLRTRPIEFKNTFLVYIGDKDYETYFDSKSPLEPDKLKDALLWIATGRPKAIVVDIETDSPEFSKLRSEKWNGVPVVWAQTAHQPEAEAGEHAEEHHEGGHHELPALETAPVLGGNDLTSIHTGLAVMTPDKDCIVRGYNRTLKVVFKSKDGTTRAAGKHHGEHGDAAKADSLPWAAIKIVDAQRATRDGSEPKRIFKFARDSNLYSGYSLDRIHELVTKNPASLKAILSDKIVILGGTYFASRDRHPTPIGPVPGCELIGYAIESELQGETIGSVDSWVLFAADIVCGILFVLVMHKLPRTSALFWILVLFPVFALVFSFLSFSRLAIWASFVPVLFGVYLHFLHDHMEEDKKMREELAELRGSTTEPHEH